MHHDPYEHRTAYSKKLKQMILVVKDLIPQGCVFVKKDVDLFFVAKFFSHQQSES